MLGSSVGTCIDDIHLAEGNVFSVLMSRPSLVGTLLSSGSVEVGGDQVDTTEAEECASAEGEAGLADAISDVSEAVNVHELNVYKHT